MMTAVSDAVAGSIPGTAVVLRRYLQWMLDRTLVVVVMLSMLIFGIALATLTLRAGWPKFVAYVCALAFFPASVATDLVIQVWWPYRRGGATPAMRWLGLRIVTVHGEEPRLVDYLVRWALYVVDGLLFGLVGAVLIAVTPRHQRFGDLVTRTVVVRAR